MIGSWWSIERWHDRDRIDVQAMLDSALIDRNRLAGLFREIAPGLIRYPAIDPDAFHARVASLTGSDSP